MGISFYLQQGQKLLENKDFDSFKKALDYFKKANELIEDKHISKPEVLYFTAVGNYLLGNIELSYRIAFKAKRMIERGILNGFFSMNKINQLFGENTLDNFINYVYVNHTQLLSLTDTMDDNFDENSYNTGLLSQMNIISKEKINPLFTVDSLSDEIIMATFHELNSNDDDPTFFDKLEGNILGYIQGYLHPYVGDLTIANRRLVEKITNDEPTDFIDEDRYILFDKLKLADFISEYKIQSKDKEPFYSFIDFFLTEILKGVAHKDNLITQDINSSNHIQQKFIELFQIKYQDRALELRDDFYYIYENTSKAIAKKWISRKILNILP